MQRVCIVGGGPIGLTTAIALAKLPLAITLIERDMLQKTLSMDYSNRVVSLTNSTKSLLQGLNVWDGLERKHSFHRMHVWRESDTLSFERESDIGTIVETRILLNSLIDQLEPLVESGQIEVINNSVKSITLGSEQTVDLGHKTIHSNLLIGADGPNSLVRAAAGISSFGYKYNQMGLVATLEIDTLENNTAWQRFLSSGPIAILPLSLTHSSLVWSLPGQLAKDVARLSENDLILVLNAALRNPAIDLEYILRNLDTGIDIKQELEFGFQRNPDLVPRNLPVVKNVTDCASFPLSIQHVDTYESKGCALVGDAAHSIHPLAGQGMNLGFGDVKSLVSCIEKNLQNNVVDSAGYTSQRYLANATMLTACDLINRLNGRFISSANFPIFKSYLMQMMD